LSVAAVSYRTPRREEEKVATAPTTTLRELARPLLSTVGLELWDVEVAKDLVRFLVDRDGGVDLEALSDASRALSGLLDTHEELVPSGRYQLEISSPGLERTLRTPDQYRRYVGATVSVKTLRPVAGARRHRGVLAAADDAGIELRTAPPPAESLAVPYDEIERTRTVFDWGPSPKPGSRPARPARSAVTHHTKDAPR
jgi:ribosome maturation factor RimP